MNSPHRRVPLQGFLSPGVHFAAVPTDGAGPGLFGSLPFLPESPEKAAQLAQLGVRYASPSFSCGVTTTPMATTIDKAWALLRETPDSAPNTHVTFGAQLEPNLSLRDALERGAPPDGLLRADQVSTFLEYQSGAPDSYFSVLVEAERASVLRFSVLQHLARVRRIYNLFEDDDVVGITNYLDFGISVAAPVATGANGATAGRTTYEAAAAWQARPRPHAVSQARALAARAVSNVGAARAGEQQRAGQGGAEQRARLCRVRGQELVGAVLQPQRHGGLGL